MPRVGDGVLVDESTVGGTPLVELDCEVPPTVYGKVEWLNFHAADHGGGSIKSRIATRMLDRAERRGDLTDETILEGTSGNTGVALARVGAVRGYDVEVVVPEVVSAGKRAALRAAGADCHFVDAAKPYEAKLERTRERYESAPDEFYHPNQYVNPANPAAHEMGTGAEIWTQTGGGVTHVVAGIGTGGTVTGVGRALHDRGDVSVVGFTPAVEDHDVEGLRTNPSGDAEPTDAFDASVPDERYEVTSPDAWACARLLAKRHRTHVDVAETGAFESRVVRDNLRVDGEFLVGPSSGAAVALVRRLAAAGRLDEDDVVVVLLCDRGDRYLESLWADVR